MDEKVAVASLKIVKEVFDKYNIEFWLDCGTLLAAYRDKKFIPWDKDLDISIWHHNFDYDHEMFKEFQEQGFDVNIYPYANSCRLDKKGCNVSINLYTLQDNLATKLWIVPDKSKFFGHFRNYFWNLFAVQSPEIFFNAYPRVKIISKSLLTFINMLSENHKSILAEKIYFGFPKIAVKFVTINVPVDFFKELSDIDFYGMRFKAPKNIEKYLIFRYGKDWKIPKKDYVYYEEDGAISKKNVY